MQSGYLYLDVCTWLHRMVRLTLPAVSLDCGWCWRRVAFNVFVGTAMITELVSFSFPAALLMARRRTPEYLPKHSHFNLGKSGWLVNSVVVGWTIFATIVYCIPLTRPVTSGNMSKCPSPLFLYFFTSVKSPCTILCARSSIAKHRKFPLQIIPPQSSEEWDCWHFVTGTCMQIKTIMDRQLLFL